MEEVIIEILCVHNNVWSISIIQMQVAWVTKSKASDALV